MAAELIRPHSDKEKGNSFQLFLFLARSVLSYPSGVQILSGSVGQRSSLSGIPSPSESGAAGFTTLKLSVLVLLGINPNEPKVAVVS
jgi:hypothetical protein